MPGAGAGCEAAGGAASSSTPAGLRCSAPVGEGTQDFEALETMVFSGREGSILYYTVHAQAAPELRSVLRPANHLIQGILIQASADRVLIDHFP